MPNEQQRSAPIGKSGNKVNASGDKLNMLESSPNDEVKQRLSQLETKQAQDQNSMITRHTKAINAISKVIRDTKDDYAQKMSALEGKHTREMLLMKDRERESQMRIRSLEHDVVRLDNELVRHKQEAVAREERLLRLWEASLGINVPVAETVPAVAPTATRLIEAAPSPPRTTGSRRTPFRADSADDAYWTLGEGSESSGAHLKRKAEQEEEQEEGEIREEPVAQSKQKKAKTVGDAVRGVRIKVEED